MYPACAPCVIESQGKGRPPAVTSIAGTALCVEHALEVGADAQRLKEQLRSRREQRSAVSEAGGSK